MHGGFRRHDTHMSHRLSSVPPIHPYPRGRNIHPHPLGRLRTHAIEPFRDRRDRVVGELHEGRARRHQAEGFEQQPQAHVQWLGKERQARYHTGGRLSQDAAQQTLKAIGVPLYHGRGRIARTQQAAEDRIELDQHQARRIDALREQCLGDRPGAGAKLDDRPRPARIDIGSHGARERAARRSYGAGRQRLFDPGAEEAHVVVETNAVLLLEAADARLDLLFLRVELLLELFYVRLELMFDLFFERALALLEYLNVLLDRSFERALSQFKKALLPFKFLLEQLQGWERHLGLTLGNNCRIEPPTRYGRKCGGQAAISSRRAGPTQQFLDLTEESRRFRLRVLGRQSFEFVQQFTLALAEFLRGLDQSLNVHIAGLFGAQHRHALALKAEAPPRLSAFRYLHASLVAVDGRHLDLAAQRRKNHGDRHSAVQIGALALEERMCAEREENVEIPGRY